MVNIPLELIEAEVLTVVRQYCKILNIDETIDVEYCPGVFIKSQVLLTTISTIADALGVTIPNECYIYCDKNNRQLSIRETAEKILNVAKN